MSWLALGIHRVIQLLMLGIVIQIILSYFMDPYHPIRQALDRFYKPIYRPIQKLVPPIGGFDFSPVILIVSLQILDAIISRILMSL